MESNGTIRVLIADDHPVFRRGLVDLLREAEDIEVIGEAATGPEAVTLAKEVHPDVVLLDVILPGGGIEATRAIREALPCTKVLMLTISEEEQDLFGAIEAGANGYVLKEVNPEELLRAIRQVHAGQAVLSPPVAVKVLQRIRHPKEPEAAPPNPCPLTAREIEIVRLLAQGLTNQEIARHLIIAESTVKTHIRNILRKTHTRNRAEIVSWAVQMGLLHPPDSP